MKSKNLLRIASVIMFLHLLGHTFGHLTWKDSPDPARQEVIKQMTGNKLPFMGATRSMAEYYNGYGYIATIAMLLIIFLLWSISNATGNKSPLISKLLWAATGFLFLLGIDELIYFFPFAAAFSLLSGLLTLLATVQLSKNS